MSWCSYCTSMLCTKMTNNRALSLSCIHSKLVKNQCNPLSTDGPKNLPYHDTTSERSQCHREAHCKSALQKQLSSVMPSMLTQITSCYACWWGSRHVSDEDPDEDPDMCQMRIQTCVRWGSRHVSDEDPDMCQMRIQTCVRWGSRHVSDEDPDMCQMRIQTCVRWGSRHVSDEDPDMCQMRI